MARPARPPPAADWLSGPSRLADSPIVPRRGDASARGLTNEHRAWSQSPRPSRYINRLGKVGCVCGAAQTRCASVAPSAAGPSHGERGMGGGGGSRRCSAPRAVRRRGGAGRPRPCAAGGAGPPRCPGTERRGRGALAVRGRARPHPKMVAAPQNMAAPRRAGGGRPLSQPRAGSTGAGLGALRGARVRPGVERGERRVGLRGSVPFGLCVRPSVRPSCCRTQPVAVPRCVPLFRCSVFPVLPDAPCP